MIKTITALCIIMTLHASAQQINYTYNGSNGANGLGDYGIVTQSSGGQALLGAEGIGDIYANLNLGSNISGTRRFWHISKRMVDENHALSYYFFNGSTFQHRVTFASSGNVGVGTPTPEAKLEVYSAGTTGSTLIYGGVIGSKQNGHELNLVGGGPIDGAWTTQQGGHIRLGGSARGDANVNAIQFIQNGTERMRVNQGGNIGIGTTSPIGLLEIKGPYSGNSQVIINTTNSNAELRFSDNNVTKGFVWYAKGSDQMAFGRGSSANSLFVDAFGNFGIGTTSPNQKLTVNGTIYGKEVKVDLSVPGPDYVFEKDYKLASLEDIKAYIDKNNHLPEVPSAKEMEREGIQLGEMNMLLLKKIEELTLYVIEMKQENERQQREIENLKTKK